MQLSHYVPDRESGILLPNTDIITPEYTRRQKDLPADMVIGMVFGDEGKGKVVDSSSGHGIRFNGGHNA